MITLYLDESGTHSDRYTVVAGFAGKKRPWTNFEAAWKKGLGSRPFLHVSNMSLTSPRDKEWLELLGAIPYDCKLIPIYGAVKPSDYRDLIVGTVAEAYGHSYSMCLLQIFEALVHQIPGDERFEFVFEASPLDFYIDKQMQMTAIMRAFQRPDGRSRIARWSFVPKSQCSLFQPGDYLANHLYNRELAPESDRARWTEPIARGRKLLGSPMSRERARMLFQHVSGPGFTKCIPREEIKKYRAAVRSGNERDPFAELIRARRARPRYSINGEGS